ncbi:MAG: D-alanyl-D-alanine carboxypeptidase [Aestuariivita sp.]|nr:D-alanyl-D-alanine carboxypeptidase [Aestuariivita sp.]
MDVRTGEVLHSRNADTRLHPASLTKMMMLYVTFEAIENGEISADTMVRISKKAASEPPSKLGLKAGQKIKLRYLIRASAIRSANDAATAIAEAISKSEAAFARRMNKTAKALGMTRTTLKNAHGLTENGHLSTARDMTILGRRLFFDYPEYYHLFSRRSANAGVRKVKNTNRNLLNAYKGADGIKTGYTRAAGFNLVASARRGNKHIIATVFGGKSGASRNARVAELLDMGFHRAPVNASIRKPILPAYSNNSRIAGKTVRSNGLVAQSNKPIFRPSTPTQDVVIAAGMTTDNKEYNARLRHSIKDAVAQVNFNQNERPQTARESDFDAITLTAEIDGITRPVLRPTDPDKIRQPLVEMNSKASQIDEGDTQTIEQSQNFWGINIGKYRSYDSAIKALVKTALSESSVLDDARRNVIQSRSGFDATFVGMSRDKAEQACRRLQAMNAICSTIKTE